jgi:hypothetical protein
VGVLENATEHGSSHGCSHGRGCGHGHGCKQQGCGDGVPGLAINVDDEYAGGGHGSSVPDEDVDLQLEGNGEVIDDGVVGEV